ncbi:MAG: rane fusion protein heavy metal efflux system [Campylobacterota bacterium]|nr:rane fusion protein heavy metal efflux system [Campylobacterota bacterium]
MKRFLLIAALVIFQTLNADNIVEGGSLNIKLDTPKRTTTVPMGSYLGTYTYPPTHRYTISANVDGFITEVSVKPYVSVKKGQKLFVLKSPKLLDLQSDYISTLLELQFYQKEMERLEPLAQKGVIASKRYLESKNQFEKLALSADFKRDVLSAYGLSEEQLIKISTQKKPYPTLTITSLADTTVSEISVQVGSFVSQGETMAKLVNTSECHFEVNMPWKLAETLKQGETIYSDASSFLVFAMAPQIDPISQTTGIDLHENKSCAGRAGASVNITFFKKQPAWKIPSSAVISFENSHAVFVALKSGYKVVPVQLLAQLEGFSYISAKFNGDEKVAISSVISLKSVLKGSLE